MLFCSLTIIIAQLYTSIQIQYTDPDPKNLLGRWRQDAWQQVTYLPFCMSFIICSSSMLRSFTLSIRPCSPIITTFSLYYTVQSHEEEHICSTQPTYSRRRIGHKLGCESWTICFFERRRIPLVQARGVTKETVPPDQIWWKLSLWDG